VLRQAQHERIPLNRKAPLSLSLSKAALAALLSITTPAQADTIIDNVDGFTPGADGGIERFAGLLIGNDGRIAQIFQRSGPRPLRADFRLDGKGRVLMPGLIDSHVDLAALGLSLLGPAPPGARPRPEDRDLAFGKAQQQLLARGITAVADMGTTIEAWQCYRRAGDNGRLALRIMAYADSVDAMVLIGGPGPGPWLYDDHLRFNGLHIAPTVPMPQGPPAAKSRAKARPVVRFAPPREPSEAVQLKNLLSRAAIDHFQVAIDAVSSRSANLALDAIGEVSATYKGERRWRLELAADLDSATAARAAQAGVSISFMDFPAGSPAQPWRGLTAQNVHFSFAPAPEPFALLGLGLGREETLAGLTTGGAWAGFGEGRFGRIALGQRADFVLLDRDPMLASPEDLRALKVLQTWVGGKLVWQAEEKAIESVVR
jgi:predicted amidohydrolase YtcJ